MSIKVLIVDDSALMRGVLAEIIGSQRDLEVVGQAPDPYVAREKIKQLDPDVLTLDVEMPRMDGLSFLERLMRLRPMPVVMVSTLTERGSEVTFRALELGAVDFVTKPRLDAKQALESYARDLTDKIRAAAQARFGPRPARLAGVRPRPRELPAADLRRRVIAIGASTGGTEAIKEVLAGLPADSPPVLVVQHMPEGFTAAFARRLDAASALAVSEAQHGARALPGHAYLAPGHAHLLLGHSGTGYRLELSDAPAVNRHRPAVDVLMFSVARTAGANAIGALLTGMGKDGAAGLAAMQRAGAYTLAQDEATSVVYGMPREAAALGAASAVVPLHAVAARIVDHLGSAAGKASRI